MQSLIAIQAKLSAIDPDVCVFRINRSGLLGPPIDLRPEGPDRRLIDNLCEIAAVRAVKLDANFVSISKTANVQWDDLIPVLANRLRTYAAEEFDGEARPREELAEGKQVRQPKQILAAIRKLVDERFNPAIASHRGEIRIVDYCDGVVKVEMRGGCQGCAASQLTLRQGLLSTIRNEVPEVVEIVDTTDHQSGTDPYFSSLGQLE